MELEESRRLLSDLQVSDLSAVLEGSAPPADSASFPTLDPSFLEESIGLGSQPVWPSGRVNGVSTIVC